MKKVIVVSTIVIILITLVFVSINNIRSSEISSFATYEQDFIDQEYQVTNNTETNFSSQKNLETGLIMFETYENENTISFYSIDNTSYTFLVEGNGSLVFTQHIGTDASIICSASVECNDEEKENIEAIREICESELKEILN